MSIVVESVFYLMKNYLDFFVVKKVVLLLLVDCLRKI